MKFTKFTFRENKLETSSQGAPSGHFLQEPQVSTNKMFDCILLFLHYIELYYPIKYNLQDLKIRLQSWL